MSDVLKTDHYKLTMAEAGWPFREETFYYSHRRGGPHLLPFDPLIEIGKIIPNDSEERSRLAFKWLSDANNTTFGAWSSALNSSFQLRVQSPPVGSWISDRDPMFVVTGPSVAVSWLEPLMLQLNFKIQVATLAATSPDLLHREVGTVTCEEQKEIVLDTLERVRSLGYKVPNLTIKVDSKNYFDFVYDKVKRLIKVVDDPNRIFEVGFRSAACLDQHLIALEAARKGGLRATSNAWGAYMLNMRSVGTMGHEHVQRYHSDEWAYKSMVERLPGPVFFLLDTFDTYNSGIPNAFKIIKSQPHRNHAIRFDSGDIRAQFIVALGLSNRMGIKPRFCLEDGWNLHKTVELEDIRKNMELEPERLLYGYGGHIVNTGYTNLTRDRVAAVWKLSQTGNFATMKFGNEHEGRGKESIPGNPVLYWSKNGTLVAQRGEELPKEFSQYKNAFSSDIEPIPNPNNIKSEYEKFYSNMYSPATKALVLELTEEKETTNKGDK